MYFLSTHKAKFYVIVPDNYFILFCILQGTQAGKPKPPIQMQHQIQQLKRPMKLMM